MPGICLDALNPVGHPTQRRLTALGTTATRLEMRVGDKYNFYVNYGLAYSVRQYALVGPSTGIANVQGILENTERPEVVIIGNEPDNEGPSSWTMTTDEYIQLWNTTATQIRSMYPNVKLCAAGMVGTPHYLSICWPDLAPKPDYVNKHYPNNEAELKEYAEIFNRPVIVGEWCWKTATQQEMTEWVSMLQRNTLEHFWFCWSDGMVDDMGLTNVSDHTTTAYRRYKKAIESVAK